METPESPDTTAAAPEAGPLEVTDEYVEQFASEMEAVGFLKPQDDDEEQAPAPEAGDETSTAPEAQSSDAGTGDPEGEGGGDGDLAAAIAAIRRQPGGAHASLEGMDRQAILAWGAEASAAHNASQDLVRRITALEGARQDPEQSAEASADPEGGTPADQPAAADLQPALDAFRSEFGEEAASAFESVVTPLLGKVDALEAAVSGMAAKSGEDEATAALTSLAQAHPALQRAEAREALKSHARELVKQGRAPDVTTAIRDSALLFYGQPAAAPAPTEPDARSLGVARFEGRNGTPASRPLTPAERMDQTIAAGLEELDGRDDWDTELLKRAFR